MAKYLVTFSDQVNDVQVHGFKVLTETEVNYLEELTLDIVEPFSYSLDNASLEYTNGEDYFSRLEFKEISNDEYKLLKKTFDESFGVFIDEVYLESLVEEEPEDSDDDIEDDDIEDIGLNEGDGSSYESYDDEYDD